jgi:hypothetical protein
VKIGVIHPVTGPLAEPGQACRLGAQMAAEAISGAGGIKSLGGAKLELLLGDTQSKPDIGRAEAERVVNQGAQLLMGSFDSGSTAPMVPVTQQRHVPFMVDIAAADPITTNVAKAVKDGQQKVQYVYRNFPTGSTFGKKAVQYFRKRRIEMMGIGGPGGPGLSFWPRPQDDLRVARSLSGRRRGRLGAALSGPAPAPADAGDDRAPRARATGARLRRGPNPGLNSCGGSIRSVCRWPPFSAPSATWASRTYRVAASEPRAPSSSACLRSRTPAAPCRSTSRRQGKPAHLLQYTALDDCTRFRVLRLSREQKQLSSLAFFEQVRQSFPFPIRKVQTDHGTEFSLDFVLGVEQAGIRHRCIQPRAHRSSSASTR